MPNLNIPTASRSWTTRHGESYSSSISFEIHLRNYFKEDDVPHSFRTQIPITQMNLVESFAKINDFESIRFGYYRENNTSEKEYFIIPGIDKICYTLLNPSEEELQLLSIMKIKYGGFDEAYKEYLVTWEKI